MPGTCCAAAAKSLQLYPTLCDPMDYSPSGSSVHGILQARILERLAIPSSQGSSQPRDWTQVSCIPGRFFSIWVRGKIRQEYRDLLNEEVMLTQKLNLLKWKATAVSFSFQNKSRMNQKEHEEWVWKYLLSEQRRWISLNGRVRLRCMSVRCLSLETILRNWLKAETGQEKPRLL